MADHFVGTSGWVFKGWKGPFYPEDMPEREFFAFYARRFRTVEINNSFYHLPADTTYEKWRQAAPKDFIYSVKASRYITHIKRLKEPEETLEKFMDGVALLKGKLGPILVQLPPNFGCDMERLKEFLNALPKRRRYAMEFRNPSWFAPEVYDALRKRNVALVVSDMAGHESPREATADFVYIRLHGPVGKYGGSYTDKQLSVWTGAIAQWKAAGKDVFCYFDNDEKGHAPENAASLQKMLGGD